VQRDDFRNDLPVSRGQWRALALAALHHLGEQHPASRMDATEMLVRFRVGEDDHAGQSNGASAAVTRTGGR
jgi:hypothetical protein